MMENTRLTPGEISDLLVEASMPPQAQRWPSPGFAIIQGDTYRPHPEPGTLMVNGVPGFSAAWR